MHILATIGSVIGIIGGCVGIFSFVLIRKDKKFELQARIPIFKFLNESRMDTKPVYGTDKIRIGFLFSLKNVGINPSHNLFCKFSLIEMATFRVLGSIKIEKIGLIIKDEVLDFIVPHEVPLGGFEPCLIRLNIQCTDAFSKIISEQTMDYHWDGLLSENDLPRKILFLYNLHETDILELKKLSEGNVGSDKLLSRVFHEIQYCSLDEKHEGFYKRISFTNEESSAFKELLINSKDVIFQEIGNRISPNPQSIFIPTDLKKSEIKILKKDGFIKRNKIFLFKVSIYIFAFFVAYGLCWLANLKEFDEIKRCFYFSSVASLRASFHSHSGWHAAMNSFNLPLSFPCR